MDSVQLTLVGNLGRDPEMRYTPSGTAVADFSLACNRKWTDGNGEQKKETTWFKISAWGKQAETVNEWLHKGDGIILQGRLSVNPETGGPRLWQDKEGNTRANFEVNMSGFLFSPSKGTGVERERPNTDDVDAAFPPEKSETAAEKKDKKSASSAPQEPEEPNF